MKRMLFVQTPVGELGIVATDQDVTQIFFADDRHPQRPAARAAAPECCTAQTAPPLLRQAARELEEYFAGTRHDFTLPLAPCGTSFQHAVWEALLTIPYGQTCSYKQIAQQIGHPAAYRAVGMANNCNPLAIVIPCHRVVGQGGALVGYAAGLEIKSRLLQLERR